MGVLQHVGRIRVLKFVPYNVFKSAVSTNKIMLKMKTVEKEGGGVGVLPKPKEFRFVSEKDDVIAIKPDGELSTNSYHLDPVGVLSSELLDCRALSPAGASIGTPEPEQDGQAIALSGLGEADVRPAGQIEHGVGRQVGRLWLGGRRLGRCWWLGGR